MNTTPERMALLFSGFKKEHPGKLLQSDAMPIFIVPPHGKHGDLAIAMGQAVSVACGEATNHDHQHVPVALKLLHSDPSPDQGTAQRLRFCPQTTPPTQKEEREHARTGHLTPAHYSNSASSCDAPGIAEDVRPWDSPTSPCTATERAESITTTPDVHAQDERDSQWLSLPRVLHSTDGSASWTTQDLPSLEPHDLVEQSAPLPPPPPAERAPEPWQLTTIPPPPPPAPPAEPAPEPPAQDERKAPMPKQRGAQAPGLTMISTTHAQATGRSYPSTTTLDPPALDGLQLYPALDPPALDPPTEHAVPTTEHAEVLHCYRAHSPDPNDDGIAGVELHTHFDHDGHMTPHSQRSRWSDDDAMRQHVPDHLEPEAEKLYCSISLLMGSANFDNVEVEKIIHHCIQERVTSSHDVIQSLEEICYPFFFAERTDDTKWEPHDLHHIMQNLCWYDCFRQEVLHKHDLQATMELTEDQVSECWKLYLGCFVIMSSEQTSAQRTLLVTCLPKCTTT